MSEIILSIRTHQGEYHNVLCRFQSEDSMEQGDENDFQICRSSLQEWLDRHYPGQILDIDDGESIKIDDRNPEFPTDVLVFEN